MTPEHIHLALNHVTFLGLACAIVPLAIGVALNHKATMLSGLLLAVVCGWSVGPVMGSGEEAYERYLAGPVSPLLSEGSDYWLEVHEERAHTWSKLMYATAAVSTLALVAGLAGARLGQWWKPVYLRGLAALVIVLCLGSTAAGVYIAEAGGKIRRPDFRTGANAALLDIAPTATGNARADDDHDEHGADDDD